MFAKGLKFLEALSPTMLLAALTGLTCVIGYFDYLAGTDTTFSAIYLFPVGIAAWFLGPMVAYGLAILSSVLWVGGDVLAGAHYSSTAVPLWNLAIRFAVFAVPLHLIVELRKLHDRMEERAKERAAKLTAEIAARERLERELLNISEREQRRVGHDIHDSLCQHLTGTALAGQVLSETLKAQGSPHAAKAARVVELIEDGITLSRNLAKGLDSVTLSTDGLMEALEDFANSTSDLFKISCRFECPLPVLVDADTAIHLYRIAQEAVSNSVKHGHAKNILVRLETSESGKMLHVTDDGKGIPARVNGKGMGLRIMAYRAELIGAQLNVRRQDGAGTIVTCLLPVEKRVPA